MSRETEPSPTQTGVTRDSKLFSTTGTEMLSPLTLVLVRHGVTEMTAAQQMSGSGVPGPHLNPTGRVQVAKAADAVYRIGRDTWPTVAKVTRVLASPMTRTQDTGTALGRRSGLHVETEPRLREIHFGEWEGLTSVQIAQTHGDAVDQWRFGKVGAPGGESFHDVGQRMDELVKDLAAEHAQLCAEGKDQARAYALATHSVAIKSCVGVSLGIEQGKWGSIWPSPASLTLLQLRVTANGEIAERHLLCLGAPID